MMNYNSEKVINSPDLTIHTEGLGRSIEIVVESDDDEQKKRFPSAKEKFWYQITKNEYASILLEDIVMIESCKQSNSIYLKNGSSPMIMTASLKTEVYDTYFEHYDNFYLLGTNIILNLDYVFRITENQISCHLNRTEILIREIPIGKKADLLRHLGIENDVILKSLNVRKQSVPMNIDF
jgi:hypothetical protein